MRSRGVPRSVDARRRPSWESPRQPPAGGTDERVGKLVWWIVVWRIGWSRSEQVEASRNRSEQDRREMESPRQPSAEGAGDNVWECWCGGLV